MSTYKEIIGKKIKSVSSDPSDSIDGQMWYNTTTQSLRALALLASTTSQTAMSRGANYNQFGTASGGSADANWAASGSPGTTNITEEFNGSGWSSGGNQINSLMNRSGFGSLTAGVICGGWAPPNSNTTEHYNGTSWAAANAMPEGLRGMCGGGPQTAAIMYSGHGNPSYSVGSDKTKYYDGTNWSVQPATMNTARANMSGCGVQTAALGVSGENSPVGTPAQSMTEEYNGSTWSTAPTLNTARGNQGPAMCQGSTTAATMMGGNPPSFTAIENYDGTSWSTSPATLVNANSQAGGTGSSSADILKAGGNSQGSVEKYEESTNTFVAAAWASGGALNNARDEGASSQNGLQTAALYFGGYATDPAVAYTEEYNGTSWTAKNAINTARYSGAGAGTTSAALYSGGFSNPSTRQSAVEEWDGTNWATQPNSLSTGRNNCGGCGTQTAALVYGGDEPADSDKTELYNGTSWTNGGTLSTARSHVMGGVGISTAAICVGGKTPGSSYVATTEEYGGSSWTSGGNLLTGTENGGGAGTATDAIIFGGNIGPGTPNYTAVTQGYDGTAFSTRPSMATSRVYVSGTGTSTAGLAFGGNSHPTYTTATEEFTGEIATVNIKTFSTS